MIKLLTIIGARPQIIKAAAISRAVKNGRDTQGNLLCEQIEEKNEDLINDNLFYRD